MRIGIDVSQVVYEGTGAATYTKELLKALLSQDHANEYTLFAGSLRLHPKLEKFTQSLPQSVTSHFVYLPPTILNIIWNELHFLPVETFMGKLDVFHASDATQPPSKAKKVTTVHDLVAYHFPQTLQKAQVQIQKKRLAWVKKEADAIIAVSEATKRDLITLLEIPESKITVIYEGVSSEFNASLRSQYEKIAQVRGKYKLPEKYLLNVGTLQPRKNLVRLIEAYKKLKNPPLLAVAGKSGWGKGAEVAKHVKILGFVPQKDLPYLYAGAYGFVYPAIYEGFGLPVLEAMACGTPVVTSNTSSLLEVGGDAAIFVDPHDLASIYEAIKQLLTLFETDYQSMQQKGIAHAKQFTWEKAAQETLAVYQRLDANR